MPNEVKVVLCNIIHAVSLHTRLCGECSQYLESGDGDLCQDGKRVMENELINAQHSFQEWAGEAPTKDAATRQPY